MLISVLIPLYARPEQLAEALESLAQQDRSLIGEIIIGDDSPPAFWPRNQAVISASGLIDLVEYFTSEPSRGTYPNQWFLASRAKFDHLLFLHNDDQLCPGALSALATACVNETDPRVKLWFGTQLIMDEAGQIDAEQSDASDERYGRQGPTATRPVWEWCLTESIPSNSFLAETASYLRHMHGEKDGNVGDWGFSVRLANSGAWAHFLAEKISLYRVQTGSVTSSGRGVDAHRAFELTCQLHVPVELEKVRRERFRSHVLIAATRYARDGESMNGWRCLLSPYISWRERLSIRAGLVLAILLLPRPLWHWALRYKN